jgi:hypothetical protein
MIDTEIDKMISQFETVGHRSYGRDALFRDPKTRKFWELVYPLDGGPCELRIITADEARSQYHVAFSGKQSEIHDYWLDGEILSGVTFLADYCQLHFGSSTIWAFNPLSIQIVDAVVRDGDDQFRNKLCEQIGKIVERFDIDRGMACIVTFVDRSSISISLEKSDYRGPAAIAIFGAGHCLMVE